MTVLNFAVCRDAARRAVLSATSKLLVNFKMHQKRNTLADRQTDTQTGRLIAIPSTRAGDEVIHAVKLAVLFTSQ